MHIRETHRAEITAVFRGIYRFVRLRRKLVCLSSDAHRRGESARGSRHGDFRKLRQSVLRGNAAIIKKYASETARGKPKRGAVAWIRYSRSVRVNNDINRATPERRRTGFTHHLDLKRFGGVYCVVSPQGKHPGTCLAAFPFQRH